MTDPLEAAARRMAICAGNRPDDTFTNGMPVWQSYVPHVASAIGAYLAAQLERGLKLTPREATTDMVEAGVKQATNIRDIYSAMHDAAQEQAP